MTRRRWIADEVSGTRALLVGAHAEHLSRVLRARVGQEFDITTGNGVRRGRITSIEQDRIEFELGDEIPAPVAGQVTVALSIFKFDRMEWAIEKCTELGAKRIAPVIARRTEPHLAAAAAKRVDRWRRIALQAAEQSRRISPPEISEPLKLKEALALSGTTRIVLSEAETEAMLKDVLQSHPNHDEVVLALGPEGGWTDDELELFQEAGWISASLGNTILRAETAAVASLAVVLAELRA
ncbi:MAG TPA: RsmE family RNA methyltransferase [Terriglobales bacterium]|jgi:16S rRNA (uracil1498-N3)-methyltransferase|nr:RsmE family RNA methyltransferase [Terriglobales bacterium]